MNWEAFGAMAEFLGAAAVFVTLLFLLRQLRLNTDQMENSTQWAVTQGLNQVNMELAGNSELAEIWVKAREGMDDLTEAEKVQFRNIVFSRINTMVYILEHHPEGIDHNSINQSVELARIHQGFAFLLNRQRAGLPDNLFRKLLPDA